MKIPTVSRCLCCIELRNAGIILGVLSIMANIVSIMRTVTPLPHVCSIIFSAFWISGIKLDRPSYMLPTLMLSFIGTICMFLMPIFVIFTPELLPRPYQRFTDKYSVPTLVAVCDIFGLISAYLWVVQYSVYKLVKQTITGHEDPPKYEA